MAVRTGLEPATSCVTGRHSNQLNYRTKYKLVILLIFTLNVTYLTLFINKYWLHFPSTTIYARMKVILRSIAILFGCGGRI